jgi:serine/threonine-protein kinase
MYLADVSPVRFKSNNMPAINELLQQGRYRIIQPLGQNGTGLVYEAYDHVLKTNVAFKEIAVDLKKTNGAAQYEALSRALAAEAKILTEIKHESLLQIHDYFSETDGHYLVTELVEGNNLGELLEKNKNPFPLSQVTDWAEQLLDALHFLHTQTPAIIHRDVKPRNVKLAASGKIKLTLSIAPNADAKTNATIANQALHYLPLEQILGGLDSASQKVIANSYDEKSGRILEQPPDAKSDIYALGATLYYLLTARPPVDPLERSIDILEGKPDPLPKPHQLNQSVPPEISEVLVKALEIKREKRFDSAIIMRQAWRTAFVRIKERTAQGAKKQEEDLLEIPAAEYRESEAERRSLKTENLATEAENTRQLEQIKQRLREAEARRLEAEQRAAEAEQRLREKNTKEPDAKKSPANVLEAAAIIPEAPAKIVKTPEVSATASPSPGAATETSQPVAAQEQASDEFKDLFAAPPKDNKMFLRMSAVVVILVILGGAGWGGWVLMNSKSGEANQTDPSQTMSLTDTTKPAPTVEAAPAPSVETTPETSAEQTTAVPVDSTETPVNLPAAKNKALPKTAPPVKKQTLPATKTPPAGKKPVTVDDLINDN